jgi:hypothetical protein
MRRVRQPVFLFTGYRKVVRPSGRLCVYHRAAYRCNRRARENMHDRTRIERCRNSEIGTHILEGKVFEVIREIMLDPGKLRGCIDTGGRLDDQSIARELARVAGAIRALDEKRRHLINRYAAEQMTGEAYITANRALDRDLERLTREKAELVPALRSPHHEEFCRREHPAVLRQRESALRDVRGLRCAAAVSRGSRRKGHLRPLQVLFHIIAFVGFVFDHAVIGRDLEVMGFSREVVGPRKLDLGFAARRSWLCHADRTGRKSA